MADAAEASGPAVEAALLHLRALLARQAAGRDAPATRLPAERDLAAAIGVSRPTLRRALQVLEDEGLIWRHVGRGTFAGPRADRVEVAIPAAALSADPAQVMAARRALEPGLAAAAAGIGLDTAARADLAAIGARTRTAQNWREYEVADTEFHLAVARLAGNPVLLLLAETLHLVRRTATWTRARGNAPAPPQDHHSFAEHDRIVAAIAARDPDAAHAAMTAHLDSVGSRFRVADAPSDGV
ncbi:FadR/GntR family transcriptional regulator [Methylobrevis albus]|uniref:FadR family transcriptional regulator n=1 Tax=Methylobrevis albus TaxID=2793297 RepID=A0A931I3J1_9HYPH|nr:FCD domain-containing protein [Methylobrevis albus]MBH0239597.1 FadR family transcriptional regulator [Methylobrevis albus]